MAKAPASIAEYTPRTFRVKAWLALVLCAGLVYFCITDGAGGDTEGAFLNGLVAIMNLWIGLRFLSIARAMDQSSPPRTDSL